MTGFSNLIRQDLYQIGHGNQVITAMLKQPALSVTNSMPLFLKGTDSGCSPGTCHFALWFWEPCCWCRACKDNPMNFNFPSQLSFDLRSADCNLLSKV